MTFDVLNATAWQLAGVEHRGVTEHPWLLNPDDDQLYLWKPSAGRRLGRREHWAEKVVAELAALFGVPCAAVELGERAGVPGCLVRNLLADNEELHAGSLLLAELDPSFDPTTRGHPAYTMENVGRVLASVDAPAVAAHPSWPASLRGFDVFAGYVLLDALVLNRDRHAANWSVLRRRDAAVADRLCPLYDNASALALSLKDTSMLKRVNSRGVAAYADRESYARPFARTGDQIPSVYDIAFEALDRCQPQARDHWLERTVALGEEDVWRVVAAIPKMSEVARTFVVELVAATRRRIVDAFAA